MNGAIERMKKGLLEEFSGLVGCLYLSDLRDHTVKRLIPNIIDQVEENVYSDEEWRDAFSYITGKILYNEDEEEIRNLLKGLKRDRRR